MTHLPIRGLLGLGRLAVVTVAVAAVPVLLKKNRRLATKIGEELVKMGEKLRTDPKVQPPNSSTPTEPKTDPKNAKVTKSKAKPKTATKKKPTDSAKS